jgi:hypothetical protein
MKVFIVIGLFVQSLGATAETSSMLKFNSLQKMVTGTTKKQQVMAVFGQPQEKENLKDLPNSKESGELWKYVEKGVDRLSISFEVKSDIVQGWDWSVPEGGSEQDLKFALNWFPNASWEVETVKWVNPHHLPNECYFKDKKQGISVEYNKTRKEVSSISRWDPSRRPSSEKDEKPPKFCLDERQEHCTEGVSGKEWLKKWKVPLCEVPK